MQPRAKSTMTCIIWSTCFLSSRRSLSSGTTPPSSTNCTRGSLRNGPAMRRPRVMTVRPLCQKGHHLLRTRAGLQDYRAPILNSGSGRGCNPDFFIQIRPLTVGWRSQNQGSQADRQCARHNPPPNLPSSTPARAATSWMISAGKPVHPVWDAQCLNAWRWTRAQGRFTRYREGEPALSRRNYRQRGQAAWVNKGGRPVSVGTFALD